MATFDYYDDVYQPGYGTDALIAQDYKLKQREAALMEQMKASAAQIGVQPQGQMVSGYYVPPSKAQALAPLIQQIANQFQEKKLTEDRSGYRALEAQAVNNHLAQMPSDDDSIQAKLKWAQAGARIPALRSQMTDYAKDLLIKEPDRIAALQDRKDARAEARTAAKEKQDAELSYRRERDSKVGTRGLVDGLGVLIPRGADPVEAVTREAMRSPELAAQLTRMLAAHGMDEQSILGGASQ